MQKRSRWAATLCFMEASPAACRTPLTLHMRANSPVLHAAPRKSMHLSARQLRLMPFLTSLCPAPPPMQFWLTPAQADVLVNEHGPDASPHFFAGKEGTLGPSAHPACFTLPVLLGHCLSCFPACWGGFLTFLGYGLPSPPTAAQCLRRHVFVYPRHEPHGGGPPGGLLQVRRRHQVGGRGC